MLGIPSVIWTDKNGNERGVDITTRLVKDRIILCCGEVNDELAESIVAQLLYLEAEDKDKPVTMIVSGPGGSVVSGLQIIDTMDMISCPVSTIVTGEVASMDAMIALSGTKGMRKIMPHARYMLHSVSSAMKANVHDMKITLEEVSRLQDMLMNMIAEASGKDIEQVKKDCERDFWMSAEQAIEYGIVHEKVRSHQE